MLDLTPDELLTTTRTVRKRLDFDKPVPRELVEECLAIAFQAPNGGNMNGWRWIAIDDARDDRRARAPLQPGPRRLHRHVRRGRVSRRSGSRRRPHRDVSTAHLRENFHRAPIVLLPLIAGRTDAGANVFFQASQWGSIVQAIWSFMLALRARGLGSAWTTGHLWREREVAELLGIPLAHFMQTGLFPVAYTLGTKFKPAHRKPVTEVVCWNGFAGRA